MYSVIIMLNPRADNHSHFRRESSMAFQPPFNLPPTIQTSLQFCNFGKPYLCHQSQPVISRPLKHGSITQADFTAFSFQQCEWIFTNWSMSNQKFFHQLLEGPYKVHNRFSQLTVLSVNRFCLTEKMKNTLKLSTVGPAGHRHGRDPRIT